jgi:hypothetical protein
MSINMKRRGSQYEAAFIAQALKRGLDISESYGDYMPYDVVVHNTDGRFIRVQVKGTNSRIDKRPGYKICAAGGNVNKVALSPEQVDVLAAYVEPEDMWYLIPVVKLKGNISVYLNPNTKVNGRYEVWKEAWNVFQNGGIPG